MSQGFCKTSLRLWICLVWDPHAKKTNRRARESMKLHIIIYASTNMQKLKWIPHEE